MPSIDETSDDSPIPTPNVEHSFSPRLATSIPSNLDNRDAHSSMWNIKPDSDPPPYYPSSISPKPSPWITKRELDSGHLRTHSNDQISVLPRHAISTPKTGLAASSFFHSETFWLALYFMFNLGLTLYNKIVLVKFPFPYTLTAIHALCGTIGCYLMQENGFFVPARLSSRENLVLAMFSVLYTVNIAVSNLSLQLVTVPFHQVVRATSPLFTIFLARFMTNSKFSIPKMLSLIPVVAGVGFTTYGDYYFTAWGLILTLFGTFLAALKTIVTNMLQSGHLHTRSRSISVKLTEQQPTTRGIKLHPLDLLMRMSPLAFIQCVVYGWASGELERVRKFGALEMDKWKMNALVVNGMIAFGLNVVSFTANKKSGPLTMNVAANVKQALTMVLAVFIFDLAISATNLLGITLTLVGGAWYAAIEYKDKRRKGALAAMTTLEKSRPRLQ